jgi:hypothetical protein
MNNQYNIDTNAHYFVPMRPMIHTGFVSFTSSTDNTLFLIHEDDRYSIFSPLNF